MQRKDRCEDSSVNLQYHGTEELKILAARFQLDLGEKDTVVGSRQRPSLSLAVHTLEDTYDRKK